MIYDISLASSMFHILEEFKAMLSENCHCRFLIGIAFNYYYIIRSIGSGCII